MTKLNKILLREMMDEHIISHRNGKPYLKRRPKKVHNPQTEQQTNQRGKFRAASAFVSRNLDELIRPYWNPEAKRRGMTGQNLFCKINTQAFDAEGKPDFEKLQLAVGDLKGIESLHIEQEESNIKLSWKNNAKGEAGLEQNQLKIFGIDDNLHVEEIQCSATRQDEFFSGHFQYQKYIGLFLFFWNSELSRSTVSELMIL
ncbi:DUF6266 family protein [Marinifilum sp. D714]|uniref:DUF6266 family protein n=1 Tax=Marinifilum sp. D714 TaxID=2937523 RepID=UPI0027BB82AC|nr:DUF6266 family protein [Marinifilum sp. D714]MDQ2178557.1 DUF6266 family protein [Marinifilum sp. D714]